MSENSMFGENNPGVTYASIAQNKIAITVEETEAVDEKGNIKLGYRSRKISKGPNEGTYRFERIFDFVTGTLSRVDWKPSDYGTQLVIELVNGEDKVVLQTQGIEKEILTRIAGSFGDQAGLIDVSQPIKLGLYVKEGYTNGVYVEQNGEFIPAYNKNPKFKAHVDQKPAATSKEGIEGTVWDFSAPSKWQYNEINKLIEKLTVAGVGGEVPAEAATEATPKEEANSLPF